MNNTNKHKFYVGNVFEVLKTLPYESVHCVITSPPYWGLRDYGVEEQLGLEKEPDCLGWATGRPCGECYVCHMVQVFREVRRVLRKDGTLWLNIGDSFTGNCSRASNGGRAGFGTQREGVFKRIPNGMKPKNLVGIPWRVALALQADGWWLRSDIIWHKSNAMPESVKDRPTKAHEYIFLLTKSKKYFYDSEAIKELASYDGRKDIFMKGSIKYKNNTNIGQKTQSMATAGHVRWHKNENGEYVRNKRSVWSIPTKPFKEAHFAVFPPGIPEICIKAGTSEYGCCPKCGAPLERVLEKVGFTNHGNSRERADTPGAEVSRTSVFRTGKIAVKITVGWKPTCTCGIEETIPCTVLDPFGGSGTTTIVAEQLGRSSIYIDINPDYAEMAKQRLGEIRKKGIQLNLTYRRRTSFRKAETSQTMNEKGGSGDGKNVF